jgi:glycosyltransferase involved in cell wall biosynthesis
MAAGAPVITSDRSSMPEVAGDAALLVNPEDEAAIATAMRRVLDDGELRGDLRARGRVRAASFSWERAARETLAVFDEALAV